MMKNASITDIMSRQIHYLTPHDDVMEAQKMMDEFKIHHIPLLLDGRLVGIVSSHDIAKIEYLSGFIGDKIDHDDIFKSLSLHEIMIKDVVSLTSDAMISDAILVFSNADFHCLPIIDNGEVVGIVSAKDVFRFLNFD